MICPNAKSIWQIVKHYCGTEDHKQCHKEVKEARQQHGETSCGLGESAIPLKEEEKEDNCAVKPGGACTHKK